MNALRSGGCRLYLDQPKSDSRPINQTRWAKLHKGPNAGGDRSRHGPRGEFKSNQADGSSICRDHRGGWAGGLVGARAAATNSGGGEGERRRNPLMCGLFFFFCETLSFKSHSRPGKRSNGTLPHRRPLPSRPVFHLINTRRLWQAGRRRAHASLPVNIWQGCLFTLGGR